MSDIEKKNETMENQKEKQEAQQESQTPPQLTPEEAMEKLTRGVMELKEPITVRDKEIKELAYDFGKLTGFDFVNAMDSDRDSKNIFKVSSRQAYALFAKACAKCSEDVDEVDVMHKLGVVDAMKAVQTATVFLVASSRKGEADTYGK